MGNLSDDFENLSRNLEELRQAHQDLPANLVETVFKSFDSLNEGLPELGSVNDAVMALLAMLAAAQAQELPGAFNIAEEIQLEDLSDSSRSYPAILLGVKKDDQQYTIVITSDLSKPAAESESSNLVYKNDIVESAPQETVDIVLRELLQVALDVEIKFETSDWVDDNVIVSVSLSDQVSTNREESESKTIDYAKKRKRIEQSAVVAGFSPVIARVLGMMVSGGIKTIDGIGMQTNFINPNASYNTIPTRGTGSSDIPIARVLVPRPETR